MSKKAKQYYEDRTNEFADIWDQALPKIFTTTRQILAPGEHLSAFQTVVDGLTLALKPVEPFLIYGVPGVFEARNQHLRPEEWERMKGLPRNRSVHTLQQHAEGKLGPGLLKNLQPDKAIYLEALSLDEVTQMQEVWDRTTSATTGPPNREEDSAQAYFLTRVINGRNECRRAMFIVAWARYCGARPMTEDGRTSKETLTPRYLSTALRWSEVRALPPLPLT